MNCKVHKCRHWLDAVVDCDGTTRHSHIFVSFVHVSVLESAASPPVAQRRSVSVAQPGSVFGYFSLRSSFTVDIGYASAIVR